MGSDNQDVLNECELREAWEIMKEYAPLTPEQAAEILRTAGGCKKIALDVYAALMQKGDFELAAELMADVQDRCQHPDPEIARMFADILASMKHDT